MHELQITLCGHQILISVSCRISNNQIIIFIPFKWTLTIFLLVKCTNGKNLIFQKVYYWWHHAISLLSQIKDCTFFHVLIRRSTQRKLTAVYFIIKVLCLMHGWSEWNLTNFCQNWKNASAGAETFNLLL